MIRPVDSIQLVIWLLISSVSVSVSLINRKACSTDDDCDLELMCNIDERRCSCPEPYFWRETTNSCAGCAPGWVALHTGKCVLFAISSSPAATWREAQQGCQALLAQSMCISNDDEFLALQHQIEYLLYGPNALAATVYFHRGAWIEIDHNWTNVHAWCDANDQVDSFSCVQIQQDPRNERICLRSVPCAKRSHYLCQASPRRQSELQTAIANVEYSRRIHKREEAMARVITSVKVTTRATVRTTVKQPIRITTTTKRTGSLVNGAANALTNGLNNLGQLSNALGNPSTNTGGGSIAQPLGPGTNSSEDTNWNQIFLYVGIVAGVLFVLVVVSGLIYCVLRNQQKNSFDPRMSIRSNDTPSSVTSQS